MEHGERSGIDGAPSPLRARMSLHVISPAAALRNLLSLAQRPQLPTDDIGIT